MTPASRDGCAGRPSAVGLRPERPADGMRLGRRRFVRALGLGALWLAGGCGRPAGPAKQVDALVLGAGLAGLAAAKRLVAAGCRILILEARRRVGGRAFTNFALPDRAEYGAVEVGDSYARVRALAAEFDLAIGPPNRRWFRELTLHVNERTLNATAWRESAANLLPARERAILPGRLQGHYLTQANPLRTPADWDSPEMRGQDRSISAVLRGLGASEEALALVNVAGNHNHSDEVSALGAWRSALARRQETGAGHFVQGSGALAQALAEGLIPHLRLGSAVVEIEQETQGVRVRLADGAELKARHCICTLPLPALRMVRLNLPLSTALRQAMEMVPYTQVTVALFNCEPFWEQDGLPPNMWTDTPLERFFPRIHPGTGACIGLKAFINGRGAQRIDALDEAGFEQLALSVLQRIRPASAGRVRYVGRHRWGADAFAGGAYAAWSPGQVAVQRRAVRESAGSVRFAGEHAAVDAPGMEGAVRSGERVVEELLTTL